MLQVYINSTKLDCFPDALEQFAFDYQAFPLYDFATVTNGFAGNITFPPTKTNKNAFGKVDISNLDTEVTRSYPALIQYAGITFFKGTAYLESYSSGGYELRFETDTQFVFESLKDATMWEVLKDLGLRTDSNDLFDCKFDHNNVFGYLDPNPVKSSTLFPLIDNGLYKNSERYVNFFDLRPAFKLEALVKYIAAYVGRTLTINDTERLDSLFLTPDVFEYGDKLIEANTSTVTIGESSTTGTGSVGGIFSGGSAILLADVYDNNIYTIDLELFNFPPLQTIISFESPYSFVSNWQMALSFKVNVEDLLWINAGSGIQWIEYQFSFNSSFLNSDLQKEITLYGDSNSGYSSVNPAGIPPEVRVELSGSARINFIVKIYANEATYSPNGTTDAYANINVLLKFASRTEAGVSKNVTFIEEGRRANYPTGSNGQGNITATVINTTHSEIPYLFTVSHDQTILPNGFISAADLLSNLKANDVLKLALRQIGGILTDSGTQLTITTLDQFTRSEARDWTTKLVNIDQATVDFIEDGLGANNYLLFSQNDNNGNIDEYYQSLNLPSTGRGNVNLYVAPTDQTINSQAFQGNLTLPLIQFFKIAYNTVYNAYSTSLSYQANELVGYNGEVYKVLRTVSGGAGLPTVLPSDYELVERSLLGEQDAGNRCIWVEQIDFPADNSCYLVNTNGTDSGLFVQWKGNTELAGFDTAKPLYGFLPATFLDYRTFSVMLDLTLLDILQLNLNRLVYIKQLNGYFYVNKIENYTPAPNILTKVLLTRIK